MDLKNNNLEMAYPNSVTRAIAQKTRDILNGIRILNLRWRQRPKETGRKERIEVETPDSRFDRVAGAVGANYRSGSQVDQKPLGLKQ
jgi:hypothetical protein